MVKMRHTDRPAIRAIEFAAPGDVAVDIEVIDLETMRRRAGVAEFRGAQRLGFDILLRIERGATVHAVDLVAYELVPGDTLWIHAGQVQQWGDIGAIDGPVALFTSRAIDADTLARIRATGMALRSLFPAGLGAAGQDLAWSHLRHCATVAARVTDTVGGALVARSLAALLLELVAAADAPGPARRQPAEDFLRLRDAIENGFATERRVAAYARRLGYSTRTVDRLARANAGVTAKALIDERVVLEAQRMLLHGDEPVAAIAGALGFDDPSNFSRYFTQRAGTTPAAFRRRAGGREAPLRSSGRPVSAAGRPRTGLS
jgi:AraC-like DNA-binding protein